MNKIHKIKGRRKGIDRLENLHFNWKYKAGEGLQLLQKIH